MSLTRRTALGALAATLTATSATQAVAKVSEAPDLLALTDRLSDALAAFHEANRRIADILGRGIQARWGKRDFIAVAKLRHP